MVGPLEEKIDFSAPWDLKLKELQTIRASKLYTNNKIPFHGRETASIFRFSAENFASDFNNLKMTLFYLVHSLTNQLIQWTFDEQICTANQIQHNEIPIIN